jgi:cell wall assembly regulator SMI1
MGKTTSKTTLKKLHIECWNKKHQLYKRIKNSNKENDNLIWKINKWEENLKFWIERQIEKKYQIHKGIQSKKIKIKRMRNKSEKKLKKNKILDLIMKLKTN